MISLLQILMSLKSYFLLDKVFVLTNQKLFIIENDIFRRTYIFPVSILKQSRITIKQIVFPRHIDITKVTISMPDKIDLRFYFGGHKIPQSLSETINTITNPENNSVIKYSKELNKRYILLLILTGNILVITLLIVIIAYKNNNRKCLTTAST
jgi:hypothetical protein